MHFYKLISSHLFEGRLTGGHGRATCKSSSHSSTSEWSIFFSEKKKEKEEHIIPLLKFENKIRYFPSLSTVFKPTIGSMIIDNKYNSMAINPTYNGKISGEVSHPVLFKAV